MTPRIIEFTRKEYDIIPRSRGIEEPQNMSTEELLNALSRYDSKKLLEKIAKKQNISKMI